MDSVHFLLVISVCKKQLCQANAKLNGNCMRFRLATVEELCNDVTLEVIRKSRRLIPSWIVLQFEYIFEMWPRSHILLTGMNSFQKGIDKLLHLMFLYKTRN
jgi:hypothetical protein